MQRKHHPTKKVMASQKKNLLAGKQSVIDTSGPVYMVMSRCVLTTDNSVHRDESVCPRGAFWETKKERTQMHINNVFAENSRHPVAVRITYFCAQRLATTK
ncbi:hypothetical protein B9Z55_024191 [Caenorhabditis nigoni]|uniref:Uncharacterized protein n=1 Tax=Caenorhabditis nigoni TaxID=1611254 RepID=A0A2G5STM8_9PELO|nr:hypothetical protein B9Z55_024191 [Caenorhabditis nigoni]